MTDDRDRTTAILSIWEVYCDRIFNGTKTLEFRKAALPDSIERILVWQTKNVGVVGMFDATTQEYGTAERWAAHPGAGVEKNDLYLYAGGPRQVIHAIAITNVRRFAESNRLGLARGPQSWQYAPAGWRDQLEVSSA